VSERETERGKLVGEPDLFPVEVSVSCSGIASQAQLENGHELVECN
jgi:hypothetical protein